MKVYHCVQTSPEWWDLRRGMPTASEFSRIVTCGLHYHVMHGAETVSTHRTCAAAERKAGAHNRKVGRIEYVVLEKEELSAGAKSYIAELIADAACLSPNYFSERGISRQMQNGKDMEPEARRYYSLQRNCDVQEVGFCVSDCGRFGCSPDGLVGEDGLLELKCPMLSTQVGYLLDGGLPPEYAAQCHGALIVTGRKWLDFLSYTPGLDPVLVRVEPDEYTEKLRAAMESFWGHYQEAVAKILKRERL